MPLPVVVVPIAAVAHWVATHAAASVAIVGGAIAISAGYACITLHIEETTEPGEKAVAEFGKELRQLVARKFPKCRKIDLEVKFGSPSIERGGQSQWLAFPNPA